MSTRIDVFGTPELLAAAAGELFLELAYRAIDEHGVFNALLSGGSTPRAVNEWLAVNSGLLDWRHVHLFFGDERCVPPNHADSNYRMVRESMLDTLDHTGVRVYRIAGELPPSDAAASYEAVLRSMFPEMPRFDLVFLGLGADVHTASLFPSTEAIHEQKAWYIAHYVETVKAWRITATPPLLNNATVIAFLVSGEGKAAAVHTAIRGERDIDRYPAQVIQPHNGVMRWMLDKPAAGLLERA